MQKLKYTKNRKWEKKQKNTNNVLNFKFDDQSKVKTVYTCNKSRARMHNQFISLKLTMHTGIGLLVSYSLNSTFKLDDSGEHE